MSLHFRRHGQLFRLFMFHQNGIVSKQLRISGSYTTWLGQGPTNIVSGCEFIRLGFDVDGYFPN